MQNNIYFSVVIPLYNKATSITSTIQSVLAQSYAYFEIVIIDDGSTDNSVQNVKLIDDKRIRLILKQNGGVSSARNEGIRQAQHEYIAFLDADDLWKPTYLEEIVKLITDFPEASLWGTGYEFLINNTSSRAEKSLPDNFRGIIQNPWSSVAHSYCTTTSCCRRQSLLTIGMFDERISYGEDIDVWWRLMLHYPAAYYNKSLAIYRFDEDNRLMNKQILLEKLYICYFEKYAEYRKENLAFRRFIDQECMWWLYPYYKQSPQDKDVQRILKQINLDEYKWTFKLRFSYPLLYALYMWLKNVLHKSK